MDPLVLFFFSVVLLLLLELTAASPNPFPNPRFGLQENRLFPPQKPYARPAHRQQATRAPRDQHSNLALLDIVVSIQTSDCAQTANQAFATSYHTRSALEEEEDEESSRRRCHRCTGTFISEHLIVTSGQCLLFLQSGRDIKSLVLFTASSALHYRRLVELEILDLEFAATSGSQQGDGLDIGFIFVRGWLPPSLQTNMSRVSFSNNQQTEDGRLHQLFHGNLNVAGWFRLQQEAQDRCETRLIKVETFPQLSCLQAVGQRFANQGWLCAGKYLDTQAYNLNEGTPLVSFACM